MKGSKDWIDHLS